MTDRQYWTSVICIALLWGLVAGTSGLSPAIGFLTGCAIGALWTLFVIAVWGQK